MIKAGITGGIGSGKTTVCKVFEVLGIPVFYADVRAKELMVSDQLLMEGIKAAFGEDIYYPGGTPDRKRLASIVFNDTEKLQLLNSLVHPAVFRDFDLWWRKQSSPYVLKEAAILFESGANADCDYTILLKSPIELRLKRVALRDGVTEDDVRKRMDKQLSDEEKERLSDMVINNDECRLVIPQVLDIHQRLMEVGGSRK